MKIELHSHADACVAGSHCLVVHDHNRSVNVYEYEFKAGSKHACKVNATVVYDQPELGQVVIFLFNQAIEMKVLNHHPLCPMQCHMNGVLINKVPKFLAPVLSETVHTIQIENTFNAIHPIIFSFTVNGVTSYFDMRNPTWEEYEDQDILKIKLMAEAPQCDQSSPKFSGRTEYVWQQGMVCQLKHFSKGT